MCSLKRRPSETLFYTSAKFHPLSISSDSACICFSGKELNNEHNVVVVDIFVETLCSPDVPESKWHDIFLKHDNYHLLLKYPMLIDPQCANNTNFTLGIRDKLWRENIFRWIEWWSNNETVQKWRRYVGSDLDCNVLFLKFCFVPYVLFCFFHNDTRREHSSL